MFSPERSGVGFVMRASKYVERPVCNRTLMNTTKPTENTGKRTENTGDGSSVSKVKPDIDALLAGDEKEFELLVTQESPRLFRVLVRILSDDDEARNILQETFLQTFQRLHTFRRESKLTTWLYAIGINLARASLRKSRRLSSLDDQDVERMQPSFSKGMFVDSPEAWDPLRLAEISDRRTLVHKAIDRLPPDYKTIVILRDIEEHSTQEVAKMLDITSGAVRVRLHRARQALRSLLDSHFRPKTVSVVN